MKRLVFAGAAALLWVVGAQAADFGEPGGAVDGASGPATILEGGLWGSLVSQTDDTISQGFLGGYANLSTGLLLAPDWLLALDFQAEARNSNTYDEAPSTVILGGAHFQHHSGGNVLGAFAGWGAPDMGPGYGFQGGYVVGLEGAMPVGNVLVFAQGGYANIVTYPADEGFVGAFGRIGALVENGPDSALQFDLGLGRSPYIFEDTGDGGGTYVTWGVKYVKQLPELSNLFLTMSYDGARYVANTEDDATEHSFRIGLAMPFGAPASASQVANPLATPIAPFRAAAWGGTLD